MCIRDRYDFERCPHQGKISKNRSTQYFKRYFCEDCQEYVKEVDVHIDAQNNAIARQVFLASDSIQRTASRLDDQVVLTRDQARVAIRRFNDAAEQYVSQPDHPGILSIDLMSILQDELDQARYENTYGTSKISFSERNSWGK